MANQEFIPAAAARAFMRRFSENWHHSLSQSRPWRELVDGSSFAKPESLSDATDRVCRNIAYFRLNYALFFTAVLALPLVINSFCFLLLWGVLAACIFAYPTPLNLFNRNLSGIEVFALMAPLSAFVIHRIASVLMSASMLGAAIICVHAAFRVPDDPCVNDEALARCMNEEVPARLSLDDPCANDELLARSVNDEVPARLSLDDPCANDELLARLFVDNEVLETPLRRRIP